MNTGVAERESRCPEVREIWWTGKLEKEWGRSSPVTMGKWKEIRVKDVAHETCQYTQKNLTLLLKL